MVETTGTIKAAGISELSKQSSRYRQPLFLHRNLQQALAYHEVQLRHEDYDEKELMATLTQTEQSWPPDTHQLKLLAARRMPEFRFVLKAIKPKAKENLVNVVESRARKRTRLPVISCEVEITIWEVRSGDAKKMLVRDSQDCILKGRQGDGNSLPEFQVHMEQPILVTAKDLRCNTGADGDWRRTLASGCYLDICILFKSSTDAKAYLELTEAEQLIADQPIPKRTFLAYNWRHFPRLPVAGELLPLHMRQAGEKSITSYVMDVDMGFRPAKASIMEEHKRALGIKGENALNGYCTVKAGWTRLAETMTSYRTIRDQTNTRPLRGKVNLGFVWADQESYIRIKGFGCAICDDIRRYPSHETLLHHVRNSHSCYRSHLRDPTDQRYAKLKVDYVIELSLAPNFTIKKRDVPPTREERQREHRIEREIEWIAPDRPFDIQKELKGKDNWASGSINNKRRTASPSREAGADNSFNAVVTAKPEDVLDLPSRPRKKKLMVPRTTGGKTLFKWESRRPLKPGEMASESDDDIDTGWMKPRRDRLTERSGISKGLAELSTKWNDYLEQHERFSGDGYLGEAVVRFLRVHGDDIIRDGHGETMEALLHSHYDNGILLDNFLEYGLQVLRQRKADGEECKERSDSAVDHNLATPARRVVRASFQPPHAPADDGSPASRTRCKVSYDKRRRTDISSSAYETSPDPLDGDPMDIDEQAPDKAPRGHDDRRRNSSLALGTPMHQPLPDGVRCICGKEAMEMQRTIICANMGSGCKQPRYHLKCVKLTGRVSGWICPLCRSSA